MPTHNNPAGARPSETSRMIRSLIDVLASMRFAISLLTLICIASVIGTVIKQQEPLTNYVNQFGPFWADVFNRAGLYAIYSAWWFLGILGFLVVSTSLCIARNTPKILLDLKNFKENIREQTLLSFPHHAQAQVPQTLDAAKERISDLLKRQGWKYKLKETPGQTVIAGRKGASNKLGYIATHSSIVLICLGGLLDGNLIVKAQMWLHDKSVFQGGGLVDTVPPQHRLAANNPTFRANLLVPEGLRAGTAVINLPEGVVLQDLPFEVELKKFIVEYYSTGMPKLFASEILIHDPALRQSQPFTVKVNQPAFYKGVTIYQSSFDDGGSQLQLQAWPINSPQAVFDLQGKVGSTQALNAASPPSPYSLELTGLRVINVENFAAEQPASTDVRKVDLASTWNKLENRLGAGNKVQREKALRNIGPSFSYKLRDAAGQAVEFNNYMLPVEVDQRRVFLAGVRTEANGQFRYLRIPVDENDSMQGFIRLKQALDQPALRQEAARRYAVAATPDDQPKMQTQLFDTAVQALNLFTGGATAGQGKQPMSGLEALSDFIQSQIPAAEQERMSEVLLRILNGTLYELANMSRQPQGLAPLPLNDTTQRFMSQVVLTLSDSYLYPAPVMLQLKDFKHIQASVFQVTRAPGKTLVYLGSVLLVLGIFTMFYIRERRLWVVLRPSPTEPTSLQESDSMGSGVVITTALSSTRQTLDLEKEFKMLQADIFSQVQTP
jgi:cytochrome c biogenesis protein